MSRYIIQGGRKIEGRIRISGAKNSVLPIFAATILNGSENIIHDCPDLKDMEIMIELLKILGCNVKKEGNTVIIDSSGEIKHEVPDSLVRKMRSSIVLLGALLSRLKKANICFPGGCDIGPRPIDLHLKGLEQLGVKINESHGTIFCEAPDLKGTEIHLDYPSVGATENIILAAVFAKGITIIRNAAKEPEIADLQSFLNKSGAQISGAGTNNIRIEGVESLNPVEHTIIPDRIVAGTYLIAGAATSGNIELENVNIEHIQPMIAKLKESGCILRTGQNSVKLNVKNKLRAIDTIRTLPYPGFPTDLQAPIMALLSKAKGTSVIIETVFENRFKHVEDLICMGANIKVDGRIAVIRGRNKLMGANVIARDLRGGAALVVAGLCAEGTTVVEDIEHIDRGYENFHVNLQSIGADIIRE
ncbi:UDP-N-acetylglucosamine 1-carboxyvinyltransferase 1 [Oxobacter pfennigii]|uniref:UDP-N-acetylglucosamine 1-carboxyvinyltransferase n=1 Tax=Oxobacter pfennigii TaxID=36849 RepID=A0A0P8YAL4_9CLOT|nr:UDP-N-acetylglucosamine 1-carboxyvinyltransferase [Oxobacter pfennigii]KPU44038.1 UDP-N-acetylglucosamine 1-carboxyvinyltransferase 1 [Oxobacter pfennigii]